MQTMKVILVALFLAVGLAGPVAAGQLEDAKAAYNKGDYATALRLYRTLADKGNVDAPLSLGNMYYNGRGVPQDYAAAVKWYRLAADQGDALAKYFLGHLYAKGQGVPQDYVQAHKWYNLGAVDGDKDAINYRDIVAGKMTPAQIAEAQKQAREWKPKQ